MAASPDDPHHVSRALVRRAMSASLATSVGSNGEPASAGWPFASLVLSAADGGGAPLLLLSDLAQHTRNIAADSRVALLFDEARDRDDPLTGTRVTLLGHARPTDVPEHRERYLRRHPAARTYAGFGDFRLYRVEPARAHLVAGFGQIATMDAGDWPEIGTSAAALMANETAILGHMNADHADAVGLYATGLLGLARGDWRLIGIDPEGCDLRADGRTARLAFDRPVHDGSEARATLVALARTVRAARQAKAAPD